MLEPIHLRAGPIIAMVKNARTLKSLYLCRKPYKTHSNVGRYLSKSLAELCFTFAERDIVHKWVYNTWKLSQKWPLVWVWVREYFALGGFRPSNAGKGYSVYSGLCISATWNWLARGRLGFLNYNDLVHTTAWHGAEISTIKQFHALECVVGVSLHIHSNRYRCEPGYIDLDVSWVI